MTAVVSQIFKFSKDKLIINIKKIKIKSLNNIANEVAKKIYNMWEYWNNN